VTPPQPTGINYQALSFYLGVANFIFILAACFAGWWNSREKVSNTRFGAAEKRLTKLETNIETVKVKVETMPVCGNHARMESNDEKLFERLDLLHGDVREMVGSVDRLTGTLNMVQQHLMSGGK